MLGFGIGDVFIQEGKTPYDGEENRIFSMELNAGCRFLECWDTQV